MPFWNSSGHTFLDRNATIEAYRGLASRAIRLDTRIDRIILFGSMAAGRATSRSDVDLLVVLAEDARTPMERIPEYLDYFIKGPMPVDVLPLTRAEIEHRLASSNNFLRQALEVGLVLAQRPASEVAHK